MFRLVLAILLPLNSDSGYIFRLVLGFFSQFITTVYTCIGYC